MPNRLADETSPYLLQHKDNPVHWWPWGRAALDEARAQGKPILLSIGYAACHWCHVMAHESFENPDIAALMNALFVNIKVDREERPDLDQIYMSALHLMGVPGGWPLTMFLTPNGEPFWGGTYFPPTARYGRPGFAEVLREIARVFTEETDKVVNSRDALMSRLRARPATQARGSLSPEELNRAAAAILAANDPVHGGLKGAPKFPQAPMLECLWRAGWRSGDFRYFAATDLALTHMSQGGIYDHIGGGYARYAVDESWLVPHFEKMLYDNAQILDLLALSHARRPNPLYAARARETADWLLREMRIGEGGFAASLDADSEGEEGRFYVWAKDEIDRLCDAQNAALCAATYGISSAGNFDGKNILNRLNTLEYIPEDEAKIAALHQLLRLERSKRTPPARDTKILADWNGLMIVALVHAAISFANAKWLHVAQQVFDFIVSNMSSGDRLGHSWAGGRLNRPGLASDHAAMIAAALALFEVTRRPETLAQALRWQASLDAQHHDLQTGRYFLAASDADDVIVRTDPTQDDALPNHHGLIAQNLLRLHLFTGDDHWRQRTDHLFDALIPLAAQNVFAHLSLFNALDLRDTGLEILISGDDALADELFAAALALPHAIRVVHRLQGPSTLPQSHPAHAARQSAQGSAAFICTGQTCRPPVHSREAFVEAINALV